MSHQAHVFSACLHTAECVPKNAVVFSFPPPGTLLIQSVDLEKKGAAPRRKRHNILEGSTTENLNFPVSILSLVLVFFLIALRFLVCCNIICIEFNHGLVDEMTKTKCETFLF